MVDGYGDLNGEVTATTDLPAPTLNSLEVTGDDILAEYTLNDNSADGDVAIEVSTDGGNSWTVEGTQSDLSATTVTAVDVADETTFSVRVTRRTDHTQSSSGTLPETTESFTEINVGTRAVSFGWENPDSLSQDGYTIERRQVGVTEFEEIADVGAGVGEYTDTGLIPNTGYEYRVTAYTTGGSSELAGIGAVTTLGGGSSPRVSASGFSISITHPVSGRTIRPDAINPDQVQFVPGPNTMPRVRMPVRRAPSWLSEEFDDNPAMDVYLDGEQLPIDELVDVELEQGQTILVGEGGTELRTTVQAEYEAEERPTAATDLVSANTSYDVVDNTEAAEPDTIQVQSPSGESELLNALSAADDFPITGTSGGVKPTVTNHLSEGEDTTTRSGASIVSRSDFSGGDGVEYDGTGQTATWEFTTAYDMPEAAVSFYVRDEGDEMPEIEFRIKNQTVDTLPESAGGTSLAWTDVADGFYGGPGWTGGTLEAGTHTLEIEATTNPSASGGYYDVDVVCLLDNRYAYTFDNSVNTSSGYLDGPELHPPSLDAVFDAYESAFSVVGGAATATVNDISNAQALALSNDFGSTYPISASNSTSVSGDFPSPGAALNLRATLSRYSPNGARNQTPRFGYDAQRLDAYTLEADVAAESLLIDQTFSNNLANILGQILGSQYGWSITNEGGTTTFTVDEPGSTVADRDPEISESQITKRVQTYADVTIKGSTIPVSGEQFQASTSFVNLAEDDILTGSEAVYDSGGTNYTRGVDYAMDYQNGQIRTLDGGSLSTGTSYSIDYRHQIQATYDVPNESGDTLTRTIPGVVSDRQAEQIAYVLAEVDPALRSPRYEGSIVVPRLDATFDPLEGLELADQDLPDVATPLSIRGEPQLTPLGLNLQLGSKPRLEEALSNISSQVNALADRS